VRKTLRDFVVSIVIVADDYEGEESSNQQGKEYNASYLLPHPSW
jgi:hypothetical protein